jgi:hypothetical protein
MIVQSIICPAIYIDVEAMKKRIQQEHDEWEERYRQQKIKDAAEVSVCVTSKCPLLSYRFVRGKGKEEWCLCGNAHLNMTSRYNEAQHCTITIQCEYAEKRN